MPGSGQLLRKGSRHPWTPRGSCCSSQLLKANIRGPGGGPLLVLPVNIRGVPEITAVELLREAKDWGVGHTPCDDAVGVHLVCVRTGVCNWAGRLRG